MAKSGRRKSKQSQIYFRTRLLVGAVVVVLVTGTGLIARMVSKPTSLPAPKSEPPITTTTGPANSLSKEYIYAGSKLLATSEPLVSPNGDNAAFVSMCIHVWSGCDQGCFPMPPAYPLVSGQPYLTEVTMRNTGTTTWTASSQYKLGSVSTTSWGTTRALLTTSVAPGQQFTFTFSVTKPSSPPDSTLDLQWQMVQDSGVGFFGEKTPSAPVPGNDVINDCWPLFSTAAAFVSQSVPSFMFAGQTYPASVTMQNAGTVTWTGADNFKLGSQCPQDSNTWGVNRVALPSTTASGASAIFSFSATAPTAPGLYNFQWMMVQDGASGIGFFSNITPSFAISVTSKAVMGYLDYNLDAKTDLGLWRPSSKQWLIDTNLNGTTDNTYTFGSSTTDLPIPGDYNGDGKADLATIKSFSWKFDFDRNGVADQTIAYGSTGDIPVPHDFNGDKQTDIAVFRPSTGQWLIDTNRDGTTDISLTLGQNGDIPTPADFNGDGTADLAVFRPTTGQWLIDLDRNGVADLTISLGQNADLPVAMDYNGDGRADIAVFRPSTGQWLIDTDRNGSADLTVSMGQSGDIPTPADYNGDGKADVAVFRPSTLKWIIDTNRDGSPEYTLSFGTGGDIPLRQNGWILKTMGILPL